MGLTREVFHHDVSRFLALLEKEGVTPEDLQHLCKYSGFGRRVGEMIKRAVILHTQALSGSRAAAADIDDMEMLKDVCLVLQDGEAFAEALARLPPNFAAMVARYHETPDCVAAALKKVEDYILETWKKYYSPGWRLDLVLTEMEHRLR